MVPKRLQYAVWGWPERFAMMRAGWGWDATSMLTQKATAYFGAPVFALNAARTGLILALRCFARREPGRRHVVVPAYVCPAVTQAVRAAGCVPLFVAVRGDLNLDPQALHKTLNRHAGHVLAVVMTHAYATPAASANVAELCRTAGVFLVDDAAHGPVCDEDGTPLGRHGQIGLVSFAQSKTLSVGVGGSGGLLVVNDLDFKDELARAVAQLPIARGRWTALWHFVLRYRAPRWVGRADALRERILRRPFVADFTPARIAPLDAAIAIAQWRRLDALHAARTRVAGWYATALARVGQLGRLGPVEAPQLQVGRYVSRVMVRVPGPGAVERLARLGVPARRGYSEVAGHWLELPLDVTMCAGDVDAVCDSLTQVLGR